MHVLEGLVVSLTILGCGKPSTGRLRVAGGGKHGPCTQGLLTACRAWKEIIAVPVTRMVEEGTEHWESGERSISVGPGGGSF